MATLVIVTHEFDHFAFRTRSAPDKITSPYLLFDVLRQIETLGHRWRVVKGPKAAPGDAALLHVDSTVVDDEYLALRDEYATTLNFGTVDISKRQVSRIILSKGTPWSGRVLVKTNLNNGGKMEEIHNQWAAKFGRPLPHPGVAPNEQYRIFERIDDVGNEIWADPSLVVERFLPEADDCGGFVLRTWVFMGARERCTRMVTSDWISKAADVIRYEPAEVPPQLRAERERLCFDFGKFDFLMHDGEPVLLDANRTPGVAAAIRPLMKAGARNLAEGLDGLLRVRS